MITLSVVPARAQFRPGEQIDLKVEVRGAPAGPVRVVGRVTGGAPRRAPGGSEQPDFTHELVVDSTGFARAVISVDSPMDGVTTRGAVGFDVRVEIRELQLAASTAFDVAAHWSQAPRYGFFADFPPTESAEETSARADVMLALHLNVIQFYDWMLSHHTLVPETDVFIDPLDRELSRDVVTRKVNAAHDRGMAAIAYGALYGAEHDFSQQHQDWLLYNGKKDELELADIFYLQDIREVSGWRRWILDQYRDTITRMSFDGIHIDQYGYPKRSLSRATGDWEVVDLAAEFTGFVEQATSEVLEVAPEGGSIFNLVNAWPLEDMTAVRSDAATYIEVWEPHSTYRDLYELIRRSRLVRPDKHVILAAYLRMFHPVDGRTLGAMTTFRLAWAAIAASGGFHLIAGEGSGLLTEAYYPNYGRLAGADADTLQRYADFVVRHTEALHAQATDVAWTQVGPTNDVILLEHPDLPTDHRMGYSAGAVLGTVWTVARDLGPATALNLVNLVGISTDLWNADQPTPPTPFAGIQVKVVVTDDIVGVWWDTPDDGEGPRSLDFAVVDEEKNRFLTFTVPSLDVWSLVWWERSR